jgi:hypothetical protein
MGALNWLFGSRVQQRVSMRCSRAQQRASACTRRHRSASSILLTVVLLWFAGTVPASAQEKPQPPADVFGSGDSELALPPVPKDFIRERVGKVTWAYHPSAVDLAQDLERELPAIYRRIGAEFGSPELDSTMEIRIARGPSDMIALAPAGAAPPSYAVGVAYPAVGLVILSVVNPQSWLPPDLSGVLTHELSHIALHRAVSGKYLPLWFVEGLAIHQAGEQNLARVQVLWEAAAVDEILTLSSLSRNFPSRPHEVNLAYAQSADLVEHLLRNANDRERLPVLLRSVAKGLTFEQSMLESYHIDIAYLDREWRQALAERFRVLPLVLTGTVLWGGIAILVVVAFVRRRRDHHAKLARWAEEEAAHERALQALELDRQVALREEAAREASVVAALPPEAGVPTIEHEGQRYTLH